ncbi:RHS repeat-associated core domain-containing protein [Cryobacterium sp. PH31-O1]|uniref:RHS repeat-associated core domain-containing protein n=1 Tax=Cryobacterium sp. PH31-O1 TaxID=3046306 RepID=UPI0024B8AA39|nr:RHS repeat-associated core domain-containing protein [Cryobacterium sp. PH31-O1]MDJ0336751.1 RHS repeat-associated core domain-containing protein [Cryobacterium sp. PH31-O1]
MNLGNGNLLITSSEGVLNGPGLSLRNDRFYNGLSTRDGSFGGGWLSSLLADDIGLLDSGATATFAGPSGFLATFTKSGSAYVAPFGFNATLIKDANGFTLTYNRTGEQLKFSLSGFLLTDFDRNGQGVTYTYSGSQMVSAFQSSGRHIDISYDTAGKVDIISDSAGRSVSYARNSTGQLKSVDSVRETFLYDSTGRLSEARFIGTGGTGDTATTQRVVFTYDSSHRVTAVKRGTVASSTFLATTTYTYASGQTTVTNPNGSASVFTIDTAGRVTATKDALNRSRSQSWTANNDVATTTDALAAGGTPGNITTLAYDALNNVTTTTLPTGAAASAVYATGVNCTGTGGTAFQPKCTTDASGATKKYDYDTAGNILASTDTTTSGTGAVTQRHTYQGTSGAACNGFTGQVCSSTDGNGKTTTYAYDGDGNLVTVTPPTPQGTTTYGVDTLGRVTSVTDGNGDVTAYVYNIRDQIVKTTFDGGATVVVGYYPNALEQKQTDSVAGIKTKTYDVLGHLTAEAGPSTAAESYSYDPAGNLTKYTDGAGLIKYVYDAANQLTQSIEPGGSCQSAAGSAADSGCVKYEYDANATETKRTFPGNAIVATTRDASGRATRITATDAGGYVKADVGYSYAAGGQAGTANDRSTIQSRTSFTEVAIPAGAITSYAYDSLNRVKTATEKAGTVTNASWAYTYDNAGNRTQQIRTGNTGAAAGTIGYTYNAANRLASTTADTTNWTYDAAGNQTRNGITGQTATYNSRGAVTAIGATTYTGFGQGNTEQLTRSSSTTTYTSSALGLAREILTGGAQRNYTRTGDGSVVSTRFGSGSKYYYILDSLGSVIGLFDKTGAFAGGYSYSPYGEQRNTVTAGSAMDSNSLRYIASYADRATSGQYKLGARYYDPSTGRFTQFDPTGQETNPYAYAGCNPINASDPSGTESCVAAGAVLVLGGVSTVAGIVSFATTPVTTAAGGFFGAVSINLGIASLVAGAGMLGQCIAGA